MAEGRGAGRRAGERLRPGPSQLILYPHIPKTGGTTLASIIHRQYQPGAVWSLTRGSYEAFELVRTRRALSPETAVIQGHMRFGMHTFVARPCTYVTLLRDPVDRVVSNYLHAWRDPEMAAHRGLRSRGISLKEYASGGHFHGASNQQTGFLWGRRLDAALVPEAALELAKHNLRAHFSVVGLTERFDETLILLRRTFGWRFIFYERRNVDPARTQRAPVDHETLKAIESANQLDRELYDYARALFEEQVRRQGPDFAIEVAAFKRLNALYVMLQPLMQTMRRARRAASHIARRS